MKIADRNCGWSALRPLGAGHLSMWLQLISEEAVYRYFHVKPVKFFSTKYHRTLQNSPSGDPSCDIDQVFLIVSKAI